jgi:type IV pilus assembly protein PilB
LGVPLPARPALAPRSTSTGAVALWLLVTSIDVALEGAVLTQVGKRAALGSAVVSEFLRATSLFRTCDRGVIEKVAPHLAALEFPAGSVILRAGAPDPQLGVLFAGRAVLRQAGVGNQARMLEEVRVGDFFGEVGALLGSPQSTEVVAEEECTVLLVPKDVMNQLASKVAGFSFALAKRLSSRVVQASSASQRGTGPVPILAAAAMAPAASAAPVPTAVPLAMVSADSGRSEMMRFVRVAAYEVSEKLLALIPARLIGQHRMLPLELRGKSLTVGMVDPFNAAAIAELRRVVTAADPSVVAISVDDFNEAFVRLKVDPAVTGRLPIVATIPPESLQFDPVDPALVARAAAAPSGEAAVSLASGILAGAIERGASDIHLEEDGGGLRVRFRVQGVLHDWDQYVAPSFTSGLVARFKALAGLSLDERRRPQEGRVGLHSARRELDLRVSTLPSSRGEKLVMRLVEPSQLLRPLESLFADPRTLGAVRAGLGRPGAVLVGGPSGSGRTSTLYALLAERRKARPDASLATIEDPVECRLSGITQVEVDRAAGLTPAIALRALLRQDPDILLLGDPAAGAGEHDAADLARLGLETALSGRQLLAAVQSTSALGAISRLEELGCSRPLIAGALSLVIVQRLARRLCPRCATTEVPPPVVLDSLSSRGLIEKAAPIPLPRAPGCADCQGTGSSGRLAVVETLVITDPLRAHLLGGTPIPDLEKQALESGALIPLRRATAALLAKGQIAPSEALLLMGNASG